MDDDQIASYTGQTDIVVGIYKVRSYGANVHSYGAEVHNYDAKVYSYGTESHSYKAHYPSQKHVSKHKKDINSKLSLMVRPSPPRSAECYHDYRQTLGDNK